jgi:hypothetical protein
LISVAMDVVAGHVTGEHDHRRAAFVSEGDAGQRLVVPGPEVVMHAVGLPEARA